ncbi:MAG: tRNA (adenosine(37)-N6)-threonylcarbamoyltransferase complex ATPase subunit type 1 TsaE, partial [Flavobacteriaceae bacterium]
HSFIYPIVAFEGQMGSGKTTLIQSIVSQLGSKDTVSSPTFGLVHQYTTTKGEVIHMDLYRLEKEDELEQLGFEDYIQTADLCLIEWPEMVAKAIEGECHHIHIELIDEHKRKLTFQ